MYVQNSQFSYRVLSTIVERTSENLAMICRCSESSTSGESTRLPPMWPGFDSWTRRQMWVAFVVGSRPCSERFFSGYSGFPLSSKTNISKCQFDLDYCQTLYHEPLAREIAQSTPRVIDIK